MTTHAAAHRTLPPKLSYVKLRMTGPPAVNVQMMNQDFQGIPRQIGRYWLCERDPRDTHYDQTIWKEVGKIGCWEYVGE